MPEFWLLELVLVRVLALAAALVRALDPVELEPRDVTEVRAREQQLKLLEIAVNHQADLLFITEAHPVAPGMGRKIVYVNEIGRAHV